jgi:Ca2+-binding RTX toxin-like protein
LLDPATGASDSVLQLLDGSGKEIAFDDDSGVGRNSFLTVTAPTSGVYFVSVTSFDNSPADYTVTVTDGGGLTVHQLTTDDDTYTGAAGEQILGGLGDDTINLGAAFDAYGDQGNDTINGGASSGRLFGGLGDDIINGGSNGDTIYGDAGNDVLRGGVGEDTIFGGIGTTASMAVATVTSCMAATAMTPPSEATATTRCSAVTATTC